MARPALCTSVVDMGPGLARVQVTRGALQVGLQAAPAQSRWRQCLRPAYDKGGQAKPSDSLRSLLSQASLAATSGQGTRPSATPR